MREDVGVLVAQQVQPARGSAGTRSRPRPAPAAPRGSAAPPAAPTARADAARRRRHRPSAPAVSSTAPQSEVCCCFDSSTPSNSLHRSFSPCRSVKVRVSLAAIFVQRTGATVMPRLCCSTATSNRAKCISFTMTGSASRRLRFGQSKPCPPSDGGTSCTRCACPSPAESCTRHSRSRCGLSPIVSVSTATTGPSAKPSGRSCRCRWMVPPGMNCVVRHALPIADDCGWCPGEDSNFHDLAATGT